MANFEDTNDKHPVSKDFRFCTNSNAKIINPVNEAHFYENTNQPVSNKPLNVMIRIYGRMDPTRQFFHMTLNQSSCYIQQSIITKLLLR